MTSPRTGSGWHAGGAWRAGSLVAAAVGVALVASGLSRRRRGGAAAPGGGMRPGSSPLVPAPGPAPVQAERASPPAQSPVPSDRGREPAAVATADIGRGGPLAQPESLDAGSQGGGPRDGTQPRPPDPPGVPVAGDGGGGAAPRGARARRSRRWPAVAAGIVVLAAAVAGAVVTGDRDGGPSVATSATAVAPEASTTTTTLAVAAMTPGRAAELAGRRLAAAGSFTYGGTVSSTDVSAVRPGFWLAVDATIEGEVDLSSGRVHEVAVADDGRATETVVDGSTVWGRSAPSREELASVPYRAVSPAGDPEGPRGVALLGWWVSAATDHHDVEAAANGQRRVAATIPAEVLGEVERGREPVAGRIVLTLAATGDPVAVEVTTAPDGPPLRLAIALTGLGDPVAIGPPAG